MDRAQTDRGLDPGRPRAAAERRSHVANLRESSGYSRRIKLEALERRLAAARATPASESDADQASDLGPAPCDRAPRGRLSFLGKAGSLVVASITLCGLVAWAVGAGVFTASRAPEPGQALVERFAELRARALAPGSALSCLEADVGEAVVPGCETALFASAPALAAAIAYSAERLSLLAEAARVPKNRAPALDAAIRHAQRAIEQDRFGVVAQVLGEQKGCTAERCEAFALVGDPRRLRENLTGRVFESTLSRYHAAPKIEAAAAKPAAAPVAENHAPGEAPSAPAAAETAALAPPLTAKPIPPRYALPSADSIPRISIMVEEPRSAPQARSEAPPPAERPSGRTPTAKSRPSKPAPPPARSATTASDAPLALPPPPEVPAAAEPAPPARGREERVN